MLCAKYVIRTYLAFGCACRPVVAQPNTDEAAAAAQQVMAQFYQAYDVVGNTPDPLAANTDLMATINDEVWTQFKLDQVPERYAGNYVRHMTGGVPDIQGMDAFTTYLAALHTGFPDFHCTVEDTLAAGDKVAIRYRCMGTQAGEWNGIPASGKPLDFSTTIIHQIADGKVVEDWVDYDSLGFMQQLGFELTPQQ
ncbi:MAG: ester cyclase [Caldilineaceae bacterium]